LRPRPEEAAIAAVSKDDWGQTNRRLLAALRLTIAVPVTIGVFVALVLTSLLLIGWTSFHLGIDQDADQSLALPIYASVFAFGSLVSIILGAALAPRRFATLAVGILSINLVLPLIVLTVQELLTTGRAGYGGSDVGEIFGASVGAFLAYRLWDRCRERLALPVLSRHARVAIFAGCALLLLLPLRSVTVPAWRVAFVDAAEQPLAGLKIKQSWADFSVDGQEIGHEETAVTDAQGLVAFPERPLWAPVALRVWGPVRNLLSSFLHASSGRYASLTPLCPLRALDPQGTYYLGQSLSEQVRLVEAEAARASSDANCAHLVEQARRAAGSR
jgi:hypothetical protein